MAQVIKKSEFAGVGALVQAVGLILFLFGLFTALSGLGIPFILAGLVALVLGGRMAIKTVCSECRNPVADKNVNMCPVCKVELEKPKGDFL